jgi:uncharacterized membrane protein
MPFKSLKGAVGLLRHPIIWSIGLVMGVFLLAAAVIGIHGEVFYVEPLTLLFFLVVPFLAAGIYGAIKKETFSFGEFLRSGKTHYFRVLLPGLVIFFAVILTFFLLMIPLTLMGAGAAAIGAPLIFGVLISIVFFTCFYDTVAVFEETGVFESIRRSVEFVMNNLGRTILFYLVNVVVFLVLWFVGSFVWTALLIDKLEPLVGMSPAELQTVDLLAIIGTDGVWAISVVTAVVFVLFGTFMYAYKVSFFRNHAIGVYMQQGVYDEKGRWFKY